MSKFAAAAAPTGVFTAKLSDPSYHRYIESYLRDDLGATAEEIAEIMTKLATYKGISTKPQGEGETSYKDGVFDTPQGAGKMGSA